MKATDKMIEFAEAIAEVLDLPELGTTDYDEIKEFIEENKDDYYYYRKEYWR